MQTQYALHGNATCEAAQRRTHHAARGHPVCPRALHLPQHRRQRRALGGLQRTRRRSPRSAPASCIYFKHRDAPEHHEVLLPEGADAAVRRQRACCGTRRRRPRSARTRRSPARSCWRCRPTPGSPTEDRIELARSFAEQHFVAKGLAVQLDVHAPHEGDGGVRAGELARASADHHAADRGRAVRRQEGARPRPGGAARRRARRGGRRRGLGRAVARPPEPVFRGARAGHPGGPGGDARRPAHRAGADAQGGARRSSNAPRRIRQANEAAARDPEQVLATLTRHNATFTERDLDRHLAKHIADDAERAGGEGGGAWPCQESLPLHDRDDRRGGRAVHHADGAGAGAGGARRCGERLARRATLSRVPAAAIDGGAGGADAAAGSAPAFDHAVGRRRAEAHRGPGRDGQELHARGDPRCARAGRAAGDRAGADQCRGTGPEGRTASPRPARCTRRCSR